MCKEFNFKARKEVCMAKSTLFVMVLFMAALFFVTIPGAA